MHGDDPKERSFGSSDRALWQRSRLTDATEDEAARLLDIAAFADGRLDEDEAERVAARLTGDAAATGDVAVARRLAQDEPPEAPAQVVARALALVPPAGVAEIIPFAPRMPPQPRLQLVARWGSLAAAVAVAGWLGFALGMDTSLMLAQPRLGGGEDGFLHELIDPAPSFLRDLGDGAQT